MRYTKREIEAEASRLGVDLTLPYAKAYVVTCLKSKEKKPYREEEPRDASGYTDDVCIHLIYDPKE